MPSLSELKKKKASGVVVPLDEILTRQEFADAFKDLVTVIKETRTTLNKETAKSVSDNQDEVREALEKALSKLDKAEEKLAQMFNVHVSEMKSDARTTLRLMEQRINEVKSLLPEVYDDGDIQTSLTTLTQRFNDLKIPDAFDASEIVQDIEELEKEIKELKSRPVSSGGGVRRVFQPYLSRFQGDGSTKTFYLKREPLRTDNIEVWCTDFPIVLDPEADFTVAGKALTLTSEVQAPTDGAIIVCKYYA